MVFLEKFMQITFLLFLNFTLGIMQWIPSFMVENIVNVIIIVLYVVAVVLVYQTIRTFYYEHKQKGLYKSAFYTILLLSYMGLFAIFMIGVAYGKSSYVKEYSFDEKSFYIYQNTDLQYEVSIRDSFLPLRSLPLVTFSNRPELLKNKYNLVYAKGEGIDEKLYDLDKKYVHTIKNKKEK